MTTLAFQQTVLAIGAVMVLSGLAIAWLGRRGVHR